MSVDSSAIDIALAKKQGLSVKDMLLSQYENLTEAIIAVSKNKEYKIGDKTYKREDLDLLEEQRVSIATRYNDILISEGESNPNSPSFLTVW